MPFSHAYRLIIAAASLLLAAGLASMAAGCLPLSAVQSLGGWVRHADDVTPERYWRYIGSAWFLGVWSAGLGIALYRARRPAATWLALVFGLVLPTMAVPFRNPTRWGIEFWCLLTLGIGLRLLRMDDSIAYDEAYTFLSYARRPWYEAISDYNAMNNHLFNTLTMLWSHRLFGASEAALRLPTLAAGIATMVLTYQWAERWLDRRVALVALSLVACSPLMISYSTDARGYMFVCAAALALDDAAGRIALEPMRNRRAWISATLAAAIGLWSMPIMLYSIVAVCGWFVLDAFRVRHVNAPRDAAEGPDAPDGATQSRDRLRGLAISAAATVLLVAAMYAPAFIFRGADILDAPILQAESVAAYPAQLGRSLAGAWSWWIDGAFPAWLWGVALLLGCWFWPRGRVDWIRLLAPFLAVLAINALQRVAPPPRVYLFLFPWVALLASVGVVRALDRLLAAVRLPAMRNPEQQLTGQVLAAAAGLAGALYAAPREVLIYAEERTSFVSVRDAMSWLHSQIGSGRGNGHRLIAPLPCDLPALYYRETQGIPVEVNGEPEADDRLWVLCRHDESPADVLRSPLIAQPGLADSTPVWSEAATFETLRLYVAGPFEGAVDARRDVDDLE
ncbi:MAG: glycosyltransferase family 39 protein [Planctomyces sp.]|nr:glycosyltransferase family 39 protein [Planctomyces sp.]